MPKPQISKGLGICFLSAGLVMLLTTLTLLGYMLAGHDLNTWGVTALGAIALGSIGVAVLLLFRED